MTTIRGDRLLQHNGIAEVAGTLTIGSVVSSEKTATANVRFTSCLFYLYNMMFV